MAIEVLADDKALRLGRRERVFGQMEAHDLDVLLLGREANARYASGAQRLWTAGTRPFGPSCVVVRATGAIHLVSTWDEGIPEDIPHDNLFGITWNPGNLLSWLRGIEGTADARRVGTDSLTPRFAELLPKVYPAAELVDAEPMLQAARRVKTPEEVASIRAAISVAETALAAAVAELRPGVSERDLTGIFMDSMAGRGVTTPATQRVVWIASNRPGQTPVQPDDLVAFDSSVMAGGYLGELGRTWPASPTADNDRSRDLSRRAAALWSRLLTACQPDRRGSDLLAAYASEGEALPPFPIATGLGLGFDVPVITRDLPRTAAAEQLEPGMVLAIIACVRDEGAGGTAVYRKDAVLITAAGPEVLSSSPYWQPEPREHGRKQEP
jgi:Xaa-Pro aminopeptidase